MNRAYVAELEGVRFMTILVLIRHGQSVWNATNRFTGWTDVELSEKGEGEAATAGEQLADVRFDVVHTSALIRAQKTCLLYTSPSPRDISGSRMPSSA